MSTSRELVRAVSWLSAGNLAARLLALITMPLLTRWLSPAAYGEAALVSTAVSLVSVVALAGIDMSYSRSYFEGAPARRHAIEAFCWRWTVTASVLLAGLAGIAWQYGLADWLGADSSLSGFVAVGIATSALATMSQARARLLGHYARLSGVQLFAGLAGATITLSVAYAWRQDAWPLLLAMVAGYCLPILLLGSPPANTLVRASGLSRTDAGKVLRIGLAGVITAPAYWVVGSSDRWFLASSYGSGEVGLYSIAVTVGTVGMVVSMAVTSAWLPELARVEAASQENAARKRGELSLLLLAALLVVWLAVVASGGDLIRLLADQRFHPASTLVPALATGVLFQGVMHIGNAQLVMLGKLHWAAAAWTLVLVISLALNAQMVPSYGSFGAALSQVVCFFVLMVMVWVAVLRFQMIWIPWMRLLASAFAMGAAGVTLSMPWGSTALSSLVMKLPVGILLASLCIYFLAPGYLVQVYKKVFR